MESKKTSFQFERLFKESFDNFFDGLHRYATAMLKDEDKANDAVQSIFTRWWEMKTDLETTDSAKAYLYTAVYRHCLNVIRHEKIKSNHRVVAAREMVTHTMVDSDLNTFEELDTQISNAMNDLPPQCRIIFEKSRLEGKRYVEIAEEMDLSVKTIEAQMGKALRILREKLKDYL
ncbi:MAG: RNA polymerase sigma-70 factor [Bacteroidetes bacterium]|nr:RNA polymerase sigma-70 factor [Bacteroidota bacterium]